MLHLPAGFIWDSELELGPETTDITSRIWPVYLTEKSDIEEAPASTSLSDQALHERFMTWGIRSRDSGRLAAFASAVLISVDLNSTVYPAHGWRFALEAYYAGGDVNCLCLLSANVHPEFQKLGFSRALILTAKEQAASRKLSCVLAPVRPTLKSDFPLISIEDYLRKVSAEGDTFDPWLRTHARLGGEILNVCPDSVVVKASLTKWQAWLGNEVKVDESVVPQRGLVPLDIDSAEGIGIYREPNVWVRYRLPRS